MLTTCFLAALIHAIVILGVTFGYQRSAGDGDSAALEVVLVNDQAPSAAANSRARYLAQRTQLGSGNSSAGERTRIPKSSPLPMDRAGLPRCDGSGAQRPSAPPGAGGRGGPPAAAARILYFAAATDADRQAQIPLLLEKRPDLGISSNDDGVELRLRGEARRQLWIAADTRESDVAVYLDGWRHKVERVGTVNFPAVVRRRNLTGTPIIEATIGADGRLLRASLKRSSGHAELDEAAMRILKLAAPYDRFPSDLALQHDAIRIAYEWQFLEGASAGSTVLYAPAASQ